MTAILLAKYWKLIGVGLLALLLTVQTARLHNTKGDLLEAREALIDPVSGKSWQSQVEPLRRDLGTCRANTAILSQSVADQNAAVASLKADSDARAKMLADGLQQARKGRAGAEKVAAGLMRAPVGIDACARAEAAKEAVLRSLK